ncbi:hypothetical protein I6M96_12130 [Acinetobacter seifertii]|uniref:Uncharacterized protein n=1 Tax=Acinetobacter seifertii TaxID=1530123 RepID=A0A5E9PPS6_9GAMM|nr:hypothetical protein [Acinetobacter seifertii]MBJ8505740.1 hypothetical protein [Acinetobacter seifertii]TEU27011.1 hypothetical protein E2R16_11070 [Acinetobacter seifertii]
MKVSEIEEAQRLQEFRTLLSFYRTQVRPSKMESGYGQDEFTTLVAYFRIMDRFEKLTLRLVYSGKLEYDEEKELISLLKDIYEVGVGIFELKGGGTFAGNQDGTDQAILQLVGQLSGYCQVLLSPDFTQALFQLSKIIVKNSDFFSVYSEDVNQNLLERREKYLVQHSLGILQYFHFEHWQARDQRIERLRTIFDQMLGTKNSVKVLCVNLFVSMYPGVSSFPFLNRSFEKFRKEIQDCENYLGMFYKLEYSIDGQFFYFCVVVFENLKSLSIDELHKNLAIVWDEICTGGLESLDNSVELLNLKLYRTGTLQAGVISKKTQSYAQFVRTSLAYIANIPYLLQIFSGQDFWGENEPYDCVKKSIEIPKKAVTPRKQRKLEHHQKGSSLLQILDLKNVLKPLQKDIKDIGLCYEYIPYIDQPYSQNVRDFAQAMVRMEISVTLAPVWKRDPVRIEGREIIENDWGRLIRDYTQEQKNIEILLGYSDFVGPRVLCFIAAFLMAPKQHFNVYAFNLYKNELHQKIRELMTLPLRMFLEQIKGLVDRDLMPKGAFTKLSTLLTSQRNHTESLQEWLKVQERVKKRSFLAIESYVKKIEKKPNLHRDVQFTITVLTSQSLKPIDTLLKNIIDYFNQTHQELMGYIGYWSFHQVDEQKIKYIATITFYLDENYIESTGPESWFDELMHQVELRLDKKKDVMKIDEIKVEQISFQDGIIDFAESFGAGPFQKLKTHHSQRYASSHLFALVHRNLYWMHTAILQKQSLIRGRTGYKKRTRKKTKKQA